MCQLLDDTRFVGGAGRVGFFKGSKAQQHTLDSVRFNGASLIG